MFQYPSLRLLPFALLAASAASGQAVPHPFSFTPLPNTGLQAVVDGTARWGDLDRDGDMDLVTMGTEPVSITNIAPRAASRVYRNDGPAPDPGAPGNTTIRFTELEDGLLDLSFGDAALGDYDRDGDLDLVLTGSRTLGRPYAPATRLYRNDGGRFTDTGVVLPALHSGSVRWADLDRDSDLDLVLTGTADAEGPYTAQTFVLLQGASGTFAPRADAGLPGLVFGRFRLADLDGDGIADFTGQGLTATGPLLVSYRNDGTGRFTLLRQTPGGAHADVEVADLDGDRTLDVLAAGVRPGPFVFAGTLRRFTPSGATFSVRQTVSREGLGTRLAAGDYDGDGRPDLAVMTGSLRPDRATVGAYALIADTLALRARLLGDVGGVLAWGDADGDGDLDLVASYTGGGAPQLMLYRNERFDRSQPPPVPAVTPVLERTPGGRLSLSWAPVEGAGSYDVRIGTAPGASDVRAVEATDTGRRLQSEPGPLATPALALAALPAGRYYVSLQTIGADFAGSAFAEQAVDVGAATGVESTAITVLSLDVPSPVRERVRVRLGIPGPEDAALAVFDLLGRRLLSLAVAPGASEALLDTSTLSPGLYVLRLGHAGKALTRPFFVVR